MVLDLLMIMQTNITQKYAKKNVKSYVKNHITIDVYSRFILHYAVQRGPKYDTNFAIHLIRQIKKFKPKNYILETKHTIQKLLENA